MEYQILLFYKYIPIENPAKFREEELLRWHKYNLKGRGIVAGEGINITLEGTKENTESYIAELRADPRFVDVHFKRSAGTGDAFPRVSIKIRPEIVATHLGDHDVKPYERTATHLKPETLKQWFTEGKKFKIVDMRNDYEYNGGHFADSLKSGMRYFRDLPKTAKALAHLKDETVVTVCTGGVRCEKASAYLESQGFKDVYQLDGGIVSYMEKYPAQEFQGTLYVFDGRVTMDFDSAKEHIVVGRCLKCAMPSERYADCAYAPCHDQFICCEACEAKEGVFCSQKCKSEEARVHDVVSLHV